MHKGEKNEVKPSTSQINNGRTWKNCTYILSFCTRWVGLGQKTKSCYRSFNASFTFLDPRTAEEGLQQVIMQIELINENSVNRGLENKLYSSAWWDKAREK